MLNQVSVTTVTYSKEHTHKPIKLINIQISKSTPKLRDSRALNAQNIYLSTTKNLKNIKNEYLEGNFSNSMTNC